MAKQENKINGLTEAEQKRAMKLFQQAEAAKEKGKRNLAFDRVLMKKALEAGITVTEAEVDAYMNASHGITRRPQPVATETK